MESELRVFVRLGERRGWETSSGQKRTTVFVGPFPFNLFLNMSVWQQQNNVYLAGAIVLAILIVLALARASMPHSASVLPTPTQVPTTIPSPTFSPTATPSATPYFIKHTNPATVSGKIAS